MDNYVQHWMTRSSNSEDNCLWRVASLRTLIGRSIADYSAAERAMDVCSFGLNPVLLQKQSECL